MYNEFIDDICKKYNYDDNLRKAIELAFSLMMEEYNDLEGIKKVFSTVRIFSVFNMSKETLDDIENIIMNGVNENIVFEEENAYGNSNAGAFYRYLPLFDKNMDLIGEIKYLVARDMSKLINGKGYMDLFGTTINIPYFLHELNHAYAMMNPLYKIDGDRIYSKHGMFETEQRIEKLDDKFKILDDKQQYIYLEEIINEWITQKMLFSFFKVDDLVDVYYKLQNINHSPGTYTRGMLELAQYFEFAIGKDNLMRYRKDNDYSVIKKFNLIARESELCSRYFNGIEPYDYFNESVSKMNELRGHLREYIDYDDKMKIYYSDMNKLFYDALAPVYSYNVVNNNKGSIESYLSLRQDKLGETIIEPGISK